MAQAAGRWDDLATRLLSGAAVAGLGIAAVWAGGAVFHGFVSLACGIMVWELARMLGERDRAVYIAGAAGVAMLVASFLPEGFALPLIVLPAMFGTEAMRGNRTQYALFTVAILVAGYGLVALRDDFGILWMVWLALVVIATDIGGYFGGRIIGGPKIWPRVSPKKTWSGTITGWLAAVAISIPFVQSSGAGYELLGIAMGLSMASQLGDVAESAVKRRSGVKDSSSLIPGHGGLFDRFDSMLGAAILLLLIEQVVDFPPPPLAGSVF